MTTHWLPKYPALRRLAPACLALGAPALALAQPSPTSPSPEQAAAAAIAAGDARPIRWPGLGIDCFIQPVDDGPAGRGARRFRDIVPRLESFEAAQAWAGRYNLAVLASPAFPYPDVCTDLPRTRGLPAQRAALRPPRDDGSLIGAIRIDRIDLVRARLAADPGAALRPDPDFRNTPMAWAFARGRLDMVALLEAAGADPLERDETMTSIPYMNALMWGRREAALWLIARAPRWASLRHGDDVVRATVYALGPEVAFRLVDRFAGQNPAALPDLAWQAINWNSPRPPAFWLGFLADRRWPAGCAAAPETCERFAFHLARVGDDSEVRAFFGQGWAPPPAAMARIIAGAARRLDAGRVALLGALPHDRALLAGLPLLPTAMVPSIGRPPPAPTDAREREDFATLDRHDQAVRAGQARRRAATIAALRRLGVPANRLPD